MRRGITGRRTAAGGRWRWRLRASCALAAALVVASCGLLEDPPTPPPEVELPSGYRALGVHRWTGELGLIDGELVDIHAVEPTADAPPAVTALALCTALADGAEVDQPPSKVPADWDVCAFETDDLQVKVGPLGAFRRYNPGLAGRACGDAACSDTTLILWVR